MERKIKEKFGMGDLVTIKWAGMDILGQIIDIAIIENKYLVSIKIANRYSAHWLDGSEITKYSGK